MRFLVDAQLPPTLAGWLRDQGHDSVAVRNVGLRDAKDGEIWSHADSNGLTIMTKDEDFADRVRQSADGPAVVWLRVGNASNRALRQWLTRLLPDIVADLEAGERLVEVR
jgi:predicted nuclease of predicted toxin-antitoxin system